MLLEHVSSFHPFYLVLLGFLQVLLEHVEQVSLSVLVVALSASRSHSSIISFIPFRIERTTFSAILSKKISRSQKKKETVRHRRWRQRYCTAYSRAWTDPDCSDLASRLRTWNTKLTNQSPISHFGLFCKCKTLMSKVRLFTNQSWLGRSWESTATCKKDQWRPFTVAWLTVRFPLDFGFFINNALSLHICRCSQIKMVRGALFIDTALHSASA